VAGLSDWLERYISMVFRTSSYVNFLRMELAEIREGEATLDMLVRHELTNLRGMLHGGAIGSLHDTAMKLVCYSLGKRATVLGFNTNFMGSAKEGDTVRCGARILHSGRSTLVVESTTTNGGGKLVAKARGTFFVTGLLVPEDLLLAEPDT
jgi:acyl-CoA thioesterase